ncbi:SGNH/GDSL hydrolase family protein [Mucilaginibacter sp. cycad4]|uniref:SGNH/GDSL hydrolase family protein n=1 Tax=Mucilaginibacter sp. cycad4 TaxID=3342096 RepID=UPI002AAB0299|nr:SGNH/GDSL hydrolase family protein [Mucilaginibacter gossypii]WPV00231.1 SGNH/GDSL hydrolase family protein [Mucilaginibacter gossypii]
MVQSLPTGKEALVKALKYAQTPEVWDTNPITITEANANSLPVKVAALDSRLTYLNVNSVEKATIPGYVKGLSTDFGNGGRNIEQANVLSVDFIFSGKQFDFLLYDTGSSVTQLNMYVEVDGKLTSADGFATSAGGAKEHTINVNFASNAINRHVKLIFSGFRSFGGLLTERGATIAPYVTENKSKVVVFGDSYTAGTGASNEFVNFYAYELGKMMGWNNTIISGVGGTGYLNAGNNRKTFRQRVNDIISANPDAVVIAGGLNDLKIASAKQVGDEASLFFNEIRKALPKCEIIVVSPFWPKATTYPAAYKDAIRAAMSGIANAEFIDLGGSFTANTGRTLAVASLVYKDGMHPSPTGHTVIAEKLSAAIKKTLLNLN